MIQKKHPRFKSLEQRHLMEKGVSKGIVTLTGMVAFGRGEAFDYLLGEKTVPEAEKEIDAAACMLLLAEKPVISVNGNVCVLAAKEVVALAKACGAQIEANVFYPPAQKRRNLIIQEFKKLNARILGKNPNARIPNISSERRNVCKEGIYKADVVLVMLEDGNRTEALQKAGKKVIAIDLNPKSRTSRKANVTIVDNVVRAVPLLAKKVKEFRKKDENGLRNKIKNFKNKLLLNKIESRIRHGL